MIWVVSPFRMGMVNKTYFRNLTNIKLKNKGKNKEYTISDTMYREPTSSKINESKEEDWLHVKNRKNMLPIDHVNDIVNEHTKLGWVFNDEQRQLTSPLTRNLSGGVYRSIRMKTPEGKSAVINLKFKFDNSRKQNEYMVKRIELG